MRKTFVLVLLSLTFAPLGTATAQWRKTSDELIDLNQKLHGKVLDYTDNHACDNRFWSRSLGQRRDMYVYLPPNFNPHERYPIMIFLHGIGQDEHVMFDIAPLIDHAIWTGDLPPFIVAVPDGSVDGLPRSRKPATFWLNSNQGDFEDFVLNDVWDFVAATFPIRSEREAHILAGASMGGFAAYNFALRNRYCFGVVIGIHPPLNLRWMDDCGRYMGKFDPYHWGWRTNFDRLSEVIGCFGFLQEVTVGQLVKPLFASAEEAIVEVSRNNPIELVEKTCLRNGELQMYVAYGGRDEFNVAAQVESFLYLCKYRRIYVGVGYDPQGHHDWKTAARLWPGIVTWLGPRIRTLDMPRPECVQVGNVARYPEPVVPRAMQSSGRTTQPITSYWTPPHLEAASTGAVSTPQDTGSRTLVLPDSLPRPPASSGTPDMVRSPSAPDPMRPQPVPSRADLGPPARSAFPYGPYDTPLTPPPSTPGN